MDLYRYVERMHLSPMAAARGLYVYSFALLNEVRVQPTVYLMVLNFDGYDVDQILALGQMSVHDFFAYENDGHSIVDDILSIEVF